MKNRDGLSTKIISLLHFDEGLKAAVLRYSGGRIYLRADDSRIAFLENKIRGSGYSCLEYLWFLCKEGIMSVEDHPALKSIYGDLGGYTTARRKRDDLLMKPNAWLTNAHVFAAFIDFKEKQVNHLTISKQSIWTTTNNRLAATPPEHREHILLSDYKEYRMHGLDLFLYHEKIVDPLKWFTKYNKELASLFFICNPEYLHVGFMLGHAVTENKYNLRDWLADG